VPIRERKTVWILGAGFSRSLGGPLLTDLFRQESLDDIKGIPGCEKIANELIATQGLFNWGRDKAKCWENAEDFLAFIDLAHGAPVDSVKKAKLDALYFCVQVPYFDIGAGKELSRPLSALVREVTPDVVRRALAIECSRFLFDPILADECWLPYMAWAKSLEPSRDRIITFNYDNVLENLGEHIFDIRLPQQESPPNSLRRHQDRSRFGSGSRSPCEQAGV